MTSAWLSRARSPDAVPLDRAITKRNVLKTGVICFARVVSSTSHRAVHRDPPLSTTQERGRGPRSREPTFPFVLYPRAGRSPTMYKVAMEFDPRVEIDFPRKSKLEAIQKYFQTTHPQPLKSLAAGSHRNEQALACTSSRTSTQ